MGQRISSDERAAEYEWHRLGEEERLALPLAVTAGLREALASGVAGTEHHSTLERVTAYRERSRRRIEHYLSILNPSAALDLNALDEALANSKAAKYLENTGFNRFRWILAVAGRGVDTDQESLNEFVGACGAWMAANQLVSRLSEVDDEVARGILVNPWHESTRRTRAVVVYFRWASELLCRSMAAEVEMNPDKYEGLECLTQRAVRELFQWVEAHYVRMRRLNSGEPVGEAPKITANARPLIEALTVPSGSYQTKAFETLVSTLEIEAFPFVRIGDDISPIAMSEASHNVELAILNLARLRFVDDKDRSDLFENAVKRSLREVLPHDFEVPCGDVYIPIIGTENPGETDFILRDSSMNTFIGECKAMAASPAAKTVINSFTDHLGKAVEQLKLRMKVLDSGDPANVDGQSWTARSGMIWGLAVPLHPYGGAVWDHECLPEPKADNPDLAVIPVHQLLLVARAMEDGSDLARYVRFRSALFNLDIQIYDEIDILFTYIIGGDAAESIFKAQIDGAEEGSSRVLRAYDVDLNVAICDVKPTSAPAWRRRLDRTIT